MLGYAISVTGAGRPMGHERLAINISATRKEVQGEDTLHQ